MVRGLCEERTSFCTGLISRKLSRFSLTFLTGFFPYKSPSLSLCTVFDSISSNIDEVLLIKLCANVFVFGEFNLFIWLTYSGRTDRPGELCCNFSITNYLTQMENSDHNVFSVSTDFPSN